MGESRAVTSGDSNPDLVIKISHSVPIIVTLRVTPKLSGSGFDSGVGLCGIWGFHICSQNWGRTFGFDYSRLWLESGFVIPNQTPMFLSFNPRKWLKLATKKGPGLVRRAILECLAPIPRSS